MSRPGEQAFPSEAKQSDAVRVCLRQTLSQLKKYCDRSDPYLEFDFQHFCVRNRGEDLHRAESAKVGLKSGLDSDTSASVISSSWFDVSCEECN